MGLPPTRDDRFDRALPRLRREGSHARRSIGSRSIDRVVVEAAAAGGDGRRWCVPAARGTPVASEWFSPVLAMEVRGPPAIRPPAGDP
jgi:hypothetical protein